MTRGFGPAPLPPDVALPSTVGRALEAGARQGRLRRGDLERRVRGVRGEPGSADLLQGRAHLLLQRMPTDALLSHATAALLMGAPLPSAMERDERVHIAVPHPARAPHAAGIAGHSLELADSDRRTALGLPITSPGRTFVDLARSLELPDLVAVGDHLIRRGAQLVGLDELVERSSARPRHVGRRRLLDAVELLDPGAESRRESHTRVLVVRAGFPRPVCNHVVARQEGPGTFRIDLAYPERKIAIEYQGDHHRDRAQWLADMRRRAELERMGWTVIEVTADDLRDPRGLFTRLRHELAR